MPKSTFLNLSEEKRQAFLDRALEEFGLHGYRKASVSNIVKSLEIAKGSVYQYFDHKADLYRYLVEYAASKKLDYIAAHPSLLSLGTGESDFFTRYRAIVLAGAEFDFRFPAFSLVIANAGKERDAQDIPELAAELNERSTRFLSQFVQAGIERGQLRNDIDPLLLAHSINSLTLAIVGYLESRFSFSLPQLLRDQSDGLPHALPFTNAELEAAVDGLISVLQQGISRP